MLKACIENCDVLLLLFYCMHIAYCKVDMLRWQSQKNLKYQGSDFIKSEDIDALCSGFKCHCSLPATRLLRKPGNVQMAKYWFVASRTLFIIDWILFSMSNMTTCASLYIFLNIGIIVLWRDINNPLYKWLQIINKEDWAVSLSQWELKWKNLTST